MNIDQFIFGKCDTMFIYLIVGTVLTFDIIICCL